MDITNILMRKFYKIEELLIEDLWLTIGFEDTSERVNRWLRSRTLQSKKYDGKQTLYIVELFHSGNLVNDHYDGKNFMR